MKRKLKTVLRVGLFWLVFLVLFLFLNVFFQPYWVGGIYNNFETFYGFYEEPKNKNEVVFIGPSIGINGVTPTELYRDFGICAYNLSSEQQPVLASYYWLEEAYNRNPESLKVVFMEISGTRVDNDDAFYHKALDGMRLGAPKINAVLDYADGSLSTAANYFFPLINYHTRWDELDAADWNKFSLDPVNGTRGFGLVTTVRTEKKSVDEFEPKTTTLDEEAPASELNPRALDYLDKMVAFCEEKGLELIFYKTPTNNWYSKHHNAIADYCDKTGVEFLDFNYGELAEKCDYLAPFDSQDGNHLNYYGAAKLTSFLGEYLSEKGTLTDVRGREDYAYLEEHLALYDTAVTLKMDLLGSCTASEYAAFAAERDVALLVSVKGEAAACLSAEEREALKSLGFTELATLSSGDLYCAVMENGKITDQALLRAGKAENVTLDGTLANGKSYRITSSPSKSSIVLGEGEFSVDEVGINFTVYDGKEDEVIAKRCFATGTAAREDRYNRTLAFAELDGSLAAEAEKNSIYQDVLSWRARLNEANR